MNRTLILSLISFILCLNTAQYNKNVVFAGTKLKENIIVSFNTKTKRYDIPECISQKWCNGNCIEISLEEARKKGGIPYLRCHNSSNIQETEKNIQTTISTITPQQETKRNKNTESAFEVLSKEDPYTLNIFDTGWYGELTSPQKDTFPISIKRQGQQCFFMLDKHGYNLKDLLIEDNNKLSFSINLNNKKALKLSFSGIISDKEIKGKVTDIKENGIWQISPYSHQKERHKRPKTNEKISFESSLLTNEQLPSCLSVQFEEYPLKSSRLKGNFNGYTCNITSRCKDNIRILTADIPNGFSGSQAVKSTKGDARVSYYLWGGLGYLITKGRNNSAYKESALFENKLRKGIITTGNVITTKTLIQQPEVPEINLIIKNLTDNKIYSINQ